MKKLVLAAILAVAAGVVQAETTSDYVQDGLVACWDGYENSGVRGAHVTELTEWKDLVGQVPFVFNSGSGIVVEDNALVFSGQAACYASLTADNTASTFVKAKNGTVEVVIKGDDSQNRIALCSSAAAGIALGQWSSKIIFQTYSTSKNRPQIAYLWNSGIGTLSTAYSASLAQYSYLNGVKQAASGNNYFESSATITTIGCRNTIANHFKGRIYAIRLYSRVLSAAEIAANRAVDEARFVNGNVDMAGTVDVRSQYEKVPIPLTPSLGLHDGLEVGDTLDFAAPAVFTDAGNVYQYACTGYRMYDLAEDVNTHEIVATEVSGSPFSDNEFTYTHGAGMRRVVWQFARTRTPEAQDALIVPDDYASIEDALAAATSGDTVVVQPGDYMLKNYVGITVPSGVTLMGNGVNSGETVINAYSASESDATEAALVCVTNGTIRNLTFKGARTTRFDTICRALQATDGALVTNCVFTGTKVNIGGNVALIDGPATRFVRSTIANTALTGGNGWTYGGDAIRLQNFAEIHDSYITNNSFRAKGGTGLLTLTSGGKMYNTSFANNAVPNIEKQSGRAPLCIASGGADCVIDGCTITGNTLGNDTAAGANFQGAAGLAVLAAAAIRNTKITNNTSSDSLGGGVYCAAAATFENVLVAGNKTFTSSSKSPKNGCGGMYVNGAATLKHVTVTGNDVELTLGGIKTYGAWLNGATAVNCIFWGNRPDVSATSGNVVVSGAAGSATYSLAADTNEFVNASNAASGTACLGGDPLFTDAAGGDYTLTSVSPAIDAGSDAAGVTNDLRGVARPKNFGYEMGAYECEYVAEFICSLAPLAKTLGPSGGDVTFTASMTMPKQVKTVTWTVTSETGTPPAAKTGNPCTFTFPAGQNTYEVMLEVEWNGGQHASSSENAIVKVIKTVAVAPGDDLVATLADLTGLSADDPVTVNLAAGTYTAENSGVAADAGWMYALNTGVILKGAGAGQTIIDAGGTNRVLKLAEGSTACDLTITNAASGGYTAASRGYGAEVNGGTLSNCVFASGKAWAGEGNATEDCVYMTAGLIADCEVCGCTYVQPSSASRGGIVRLDAGTIRRTKIHHNEFQAQTGNALTLVGSSVLAEDCDVYNNTSGGREYRSHGCSGVAMWSGSTIRRCRIYNNSNTGGAGYTFAGGLHMTGASFAENCIITNNSSGGDAIGSHTSSCAGGVLISSGSTLRNSLVAGNRLPSGQTAAVAGGVLICDTASKVESCTIVDNTAKSAAKAGVYAIGGHLLNTIVWDNACSNETASVTNCCTPVLLAGSGNIASDPLFKSGRYVFGSASPCRNAGANDEWMAEATDVAGTARILENVVDMGCYEYDIAAASECAFTVDRAVMADDCNVVCTATADPLDDLYGFVWTFDRGGVKTVVTNTLSNVQSQNLPVVGEYTVSLRTLWGQDAEHITLALDAKEHPVVTVKPRTVYVAIVGGNVEPYDTPEKAATSFKAALATVYHRADDPGFVRFAAGVYSADNVLDGEGNWLLDVDASVKVMGASQDPADTVIDATGHRGVRVNAEGAELANFKILSPSNHYAMTADSGYGIDLRSGTVRNVDVATPVTVFNVLKVRSREHAVFMSGGVLDGVRIHDKVKGYSDNYGSGSGTILYAAGGLVTGCLVENNAIHEMYAAGVVTVMGSAVVSNTVVRGNYVNYAESWSGDSLCGFSAGIAAGGSARVVDCLIVTNSSNYCAWGSRRGVGMIAEGNALVERCVIRGNTTVGRGKNENASVAGGLHLRGSAVARNCLVQDNFVGRVSDSSNVPDAGGVFLAGSAVLDNCTVIGNTNAHNAAWGGLKADSGTVRNVIVWNNTMTNVAASVTYTCATPLQEGEGNIDANPKFRVGTILLKGTSPCRDAAETLVWMTNSVPPATDLLGNPRILNGIPDMGCIEMSQPKGLMLLVK